MHASQIVDSRNDLDRNMPRRRVVLEPVEHRVTVHARQRQIERDRIGPIFTGRHAERLRRAAKRGI